MSAHRQVSGEGWSAIRQFMADSIRESTVARDVIPYQIGLCYMSVCAAGSLTPDQVAGQANVLHPTGLADSAWRVSSDHEFEPGAANPCSCNKEPAKRMHWLLVC